VIKMLIMFILIGLAALSCDNSTKPEPDPLSLSLSAAHVSVFGGSDGSIDLSVSGGSPPYQYLWSNGAASEDIAHLSAGVYSVEVTDSENKTASDSIEITQPNENYLGQEAPGLIPKVFAPGIISRDLFEYRLLVRPNSNEVYYEIWNRQTQRSQNYVLEWLDGSWTAAQSFLPANSFNEQMGCFSFDGQTLFYSSNEPNGG